MKFFFKTCLAVVLFGTTCFASDCDPALEAQWNDWWTIHIETTSQAIKGVFFDDPAEVAAGVTGLISVMTLQGNDIDARIGDHTVDFTSTF